MPWRATNYAPPDAYLDQVPLPRLARAVADLISLPSTLPANGRRQLITRLREHAARARKDEYFDLRVAGYIVNRNEQV